MDHLPLPSGYLKLFQLSPSDFASDKDWDILLVDEAQDLSPATIDLIMQTSCSKIFVGDPHQQIYSFRGATDALPLVRADHTFYLTRVSFEWLLCSILPSMLKEYPPPFTTGFTLRWDWGDFDVDSGSTQLKYAFPIQFTLWRNW